jgi:hypothetical protein
MRKWLAVRKGEMRKIVSIALLTTLCACSDSNEPKSDSKQTPISTLPVVSSVLPASNVEMASALVATSGVASSGAAKNEFETMLDGFPTCQLKDVYIEEKDPKHPFFSRHNLSPYKIKEGFAYFRLTGITYYGLPVTEIMIPASTWGVIAITFDAPLPKAQAHFLKVFGSEFRNSEESENGTAPELQEDLDVPGRSILVCTDPN